jgi:hypothetical protein
MLDQIEGTEFLTCQAPPEPARTRLGLLTLHPSTDSRMPGSSFFHPTGLSRALPLPPGSSRPYLERLRPHYLAGLLAIGLSVSHAYASMRTPAVRHSSAAGLWLATGALGLLLMQAAIGRTLRRPELVGRRPLRVSHYWMALAVVSLLLAHILLNG